MLREQNNSIKILINDFCQVGVVIELVSGCGHCLAIDSDLA